MIAALAAAAIVCLKAPDPSLDPADDYRTVTHPRFPAVAVPAANLVPPQWKVEKRLDGDIDGDGRADLVLLIRGADPRCVMADKDLYGKPLDANPRALVVALAEPGGFRVVASNDRLIPRHVNGQLEDPLENGGVTLSGGALKVGIHFWAGSGSWSVSHRDFIFRWRDGRLALVGYDDMEMGRNTGEVKERSLNFLTRRAKLSEGRIDDDRKTVRWITLRPAALRTLSQIGDGWAFEP